MCRFFDSHSRIASSIVKGRFVGSVVAMRPMFASALSNPCVVGVVMLAPYLPAAIVAKLAVDFIVTVNAAMITDIDGGLGVGPAHNGIHLAVCAVRVQVGAVLIGPRVARCAVGVVAPIDGLRANLENRIVMACATLAGKIIRAYVWRHWRRPRAAALTEEIRLSGS